MSFFDILTKAEQRVLSAKPSSILSQPMTIRGGIDKLNGYFRSPVPKQVIISNAKAIEATIRRVFLKDKKAYLEVSSNAAVIHLKLGQGESDVTCYITNPNRFDGYQGYQSFLGAIVPQEALNSSVITRVDLNLDFSCDFSELLKSIDIKNKRSSLTYIDDSGVRTGMIIGKGNETIAVYDKSRKDKLEKPISRIELRLSGAKLPTRSQTALQSKLLHNDYFFQINGIHVAALPSSQSSQDKVNTFSTMIKRDGLFAAKRVLSQHRNFDRDYGKLFMFESWTNQPTELFKNEIHKFFNIKEEKIWKNQIKEQSQVH